MASKLGMMLTACALVMAFGTSSAWASDGRIAFSGAIGAPTCPVGDTQFDSLVARPSVAAAASAQIVCPSASNAPASESTSYSLTVASLDAVTTGHDRLLAYFVGYLNAAAGQAQAKLVTQSFA